MNKDLSYSFDFELTDDNRKAIEALLKSEGVRKYVIKLENGEYLDLVEFKEYDRLNKVLKYIEKHFQEREEYENAELVRQLKEVNVEWLENALGGKE